MTDQYLNQNADGSASVPAEIEGPERRKHSALRKTDLLKRRREPGPMAANAAS